MSPPTPDRDACARAILERLPVGARFEGAVQGPSWILAAVRGADGRRSAGVAGVPHELAGRCCLPAASSVAMAEPGTGAGLPVAFLRAEASAGPSGPAAETVANLLLSEDSGEAAAGLAVVNAVLALDPEPAEPIDGVDWLLERAPGRDVVVVGHFPFVDRDLRPVARHVWVLEREPREGEIDEREAEAVLPGARLVVITGGTLANHTLDGLLRLVDPDADLMMLGPSTPLTSALFASGFDALSGVRVTDIEAAAQSVAAGVSFRHMTGLERLTLLRRGRTPGEPE